MMKNQAISIRLMPRTLLPLLRAISFLIYDGGGFMLIWTSQAVFLLVSTRGYKILIKVKYLTKLTALVNINPELRFPNKKACPKTLVPIYQTIWLHSSNYHDLGIYHCHKIRSCKWLFIGIVGSVPVLQVQLWLHVVEAVHTDPRQETSASA